MDIVKEVWKRAEPDVVKRFQHSLSQSGCEWSPDDYCQDQWAFIATIWSNPEDDFAKLVYADWLEERGDDRCDLYRLHSYIVIELSVKTGHHHACNRFLRACFASNLNRLYIYLASLRVMCEWRSESDPPFDGALLDPPALDRVIEYKQYCKISLHPHQAMHEFVKVGDNWDFLPPK